MRVDYQRLSISNWSLTFYGFLLYRISPHVPAYTVVYILQPTLFPVSQPQLLACCVTLPKSFSFLWVTSCLKMNMSLWASWSVTANQEYMCCVWSSLLAHSTRIDMETSALLGNPLNSFNILKMENILFNRLQMDDTWRLLSTLTFLTRSSYWHCPLGLSTWIMHLKPNKFYNQTSESTLQASFLSKCPHQCKM